MAVDAGATTDGLSPSELDPDEVATADGDYDEFVDAGAPAQVSVRQSRSPLRMAGIVGLVVATALAALTGWLGYRAEQSEQMKADHARYLEVARQAAINLATIDYQNADTDIQRILDSATGAFHDDFAARSGPFVDVVKRTQSVTQGSVTEAGLESVAGNEAQALVAVLVKTSVAGAPEQQPKSWRMRLTVQKQGQDVKVSNVGFVS